MTIWHLILSAIVLFIFTYQHLIFLLWEKLQVQNRIRIIQVQQENLLVADGEISQNLKESRI